jgi:hypothetical protein
MAGQMRTYSFTHHIIMVNGREMENFGEGDDVITAEYREDRVTDTVGADGNMQASVSANQSAEIMLKFLGTAPENDYLASLHQQFVDGEIGGVSVVVLNAITGQGVVATTGYIPKISNFSRGTNSQDTEWMIVVPKLAIQSAVR